jgi:hypothetical protein
MTASPTGTGADAPPLRADHVRLTGLRGPELLLDPDLPLEEPDPREGEPTGLTGAETGPGAHEARPRHFGERASMTAPTCSVVNGTMGGFTNGRPAGLTCSPAQ